MKRRSVIKSMGVLSLGIVAPSLPEGEVLADPFETKKNRLQTDILVVGGGTAGTVAAIQAGRAGAETVLIESGSQLGGTTTTGGWHFQASSMPGANKSSEGSVGNLWKSASGSMATACLISPNYRITTGNNRYQ